MEIFGPPLDDPADKVTTRWVVAEGDCVCAIEDHDDGRYDDARGVARSDPLFSWRVWAASRRDLHRLCSWLSRQVIERVRAGARELDESSRARINQLMAQGLSLDEAIATAGRWRAQEGDGVYGWPLPR